MKYLTIWILIQTSIVNSPVPKEGMILAFAKENTCENEVRRYQEKVGNKLLSYKCVGIAMIED